jgi:hypothetical protein
MLLEIKNKNIALPQFLSMGVQGLANQTSKLYKENRVVSSLLATVFMYEA